MLRGGGCAAWRDRLIDPMAPPTAHQSAAGKACAEQREKRVGRRLRNRVGQIHVVADRIPGEARTGPNAGQRLRDAVDSDVDRLKDVGRDGRQGGIAENQPLLVAGPEGIAPADRGTGSVEDKIVGHPAIDREKAAADIDAVEGGAATAVRIPREFPDKG